MSPWRNLGNHHLPRFPRCAPGAEARGLRSESHALRAAALSTAAGGALRLVQLVVEAQGLGGLAHGGVVLGLFLGQWKIGIEKLGKHPAGLFIEPTFQ